MIRLMIGDYLRNLKERDELDYLFPFLLERMRYKIVKTAKTSHGQPEYGKDIIATKTEKNDIEKLCIFQLKAGDDRDIDNAVFYKQDGVRESLLQAKDTDFKDSSIPYLNKLTKKIILVHNGELKSNFRIIFNDFIKNEFISAGIEFDRWDIYKLTEFFSKYLLNEYLLVSPELLNLFKKSLAFLDVPEYDYRHFKLLVDKLLESYSKYTPRNIRKLISTSCMIGAMVLHYAKEADNLHTAKDCLTYILLKVWGWILEKNAINSRKIAISEFKKLHMIHFQMMELYFAKTIPIAKEKNGLFSEKGAYFEKIGYPMRSLEYLAYLIYHSQTYFLITRDNNKSKEIKKNFTELVKIIIHNNSGCSRPLFDNHSISIVLILIFLIMNGEKDFATEYLRDVLNNIALVKKMTGRFPELTNNLDSLIEYCATGKRPDNYTDQSSYLISTLFEFSVILEKKDIFNEFWDFFSNELHLLVYYSPEDIINNEYILFQKELIEEGMTDVHNSRNIQNKEQKNIDFYEKFKDIVAKTKTLEYKTDMIGFKVIRLLAHIYFKTPFFPDEWRSLLDEKI
jgi:hypothetical protein